MVIVLARGKGNGSITSVNIAVNFHDSHNVLVKVVGDAFYHMNGLDEARLWPQVKQKGEDVGFLDVGNSDKGMELSDVGSKISFILLRAMMLTSMEMNISLNEISKSANVPYLDVLPSHT
jgi:hypothetical protein